MRLAIAKKKKKQGGEQIKKGKKMEIKMNNGRPDSKPTQIQTNHGSDGGGGVGGVNEGMIWMDT